MPATPTSAISSTMARYESEHPEYYGQSSSLPALPDQDPPLDRSYSYTTHQQPRQRQGIPSYDSVNNPGPGRGSYVHSSWETNEDATYTVASGYGGYNAASGGHGPCQDPRYEQSYPRNMSRVQDFALPNYQYQIPVAAQAPDSSQPVYNPQLYAPQAPSQQLMGHSSLAYPGSNLSSGASNLNSHSYNPATYQFASSAGLSPADTQPSADLAQDYGQGSSAEYPPQAPPPPPPRGPGHPYGGRPAFQFTNPLSDSVYEASVPQRNSASARARASLTCSQNSTVSPSAAYASFDVLTGVNLSADSYRLPREQAPKSALQSSHCEFTITPHSDGQPPEPPAHSMKYGETYSKQLSLSHRSSGRSLPTPPAQQSPLFAPLKQTDTLARHPQSRPLPGPPLGAEHDESGINSSHDQPEEERGYENLLEGVEATVLHSQTAAMQRHNSGTSPDVHLCPDERHTHTSDGMAVGNVPYMSYDFYSDDSDIEAIAGLAMLQEAEEEERAREQRLRSSRANVSSSTSGYGRQATTIVPSPHDDSFEEDYIVEDLDSYSGGYEGHLHYGDEYKYDQSDYCDGTTERDRLDPTLGSSRSCSNASSDGQGYQFDDYDYSYAPYDPVHQRNPAPSTARVDAYGTGGLGMPDPFGRRLSFDYGDEQDSAQSQLRDSNKSESETSETGEPDDGFFYPRTRPLPPAPAEALDSPGLLSYLVPAGTYQQHDYSETWGSTQATYSSFPESPGLCGLFAPHSYQVPRSTSLSTRAISPRIGAPIRSKTNADREPLRQQFEPLRRQQYSFLKLDTSEKVLLDLPTLPAGRRKMFDPAKLSPTHFNMCTEPWALSSILAWIKDLCRDEADVKEQAVTDAIVALFIHKVPTMNTADAETLAGRVVAAMLAEGALVRDEEWVKISSSDLSGVLYQVTGMGCYSPKLHEQETEASGRCYSHNCMRTLKKVNLRAQLTGHSRKSEDWITFYKVPKEVLESHSKKEIDHQNILHEIVATEDYYIGQLDVLRELYRDPISKAEPPVIAPKRLDKFLTDVFGKVDFVKRANEDHLLAQLKYRQKEQGPFIVGFSDIFREWVRKAKAVYIDYAATFPYANYLVRKEAERNARFKQFLDRAREQKLSNRLSWDTFLKSPITRIQRYVLLLSTVHKNMLKDSEEKTNLAYAIEEIKAVALECDNRVGEASRKVDLLELSSKLQLRPEMKREVELNLEHLGREIIFRGDLQRPGVRTRFLVDTHAILLDHYLVLAKSFTMRGSTKSMKYERYDVSKLPIPMDLLLLESTKDDPVVKSSVRGISAVAPPQTATYANGTGNSNTGGSLVLSSASDNPKDDKILYPFRIKHLGKDGIYTLYTPSAQNRQDWSEKIIEAKTKHAAALFAQNAEPFRLRVLADTAFAHSDQSAGSRSIVIKGTPLDRALKEVNRRFPRSEPRPLPVCRAAVHCATVFQQPRGRMRCAVGTDYGVYISDYDNPRGWFRAIHIMRVTQIAALEDFNLLLLIGDKSLTAYHLDAVCPANGASSQASSDSARRAPQRLSGTREVSFFTAGRMKDRTLVIYKKREGLSSTFKVLEPVLQKSASGKARFFQFRRVQTDSFREYDEFYIPAESYSIDMFHSSLAVSTQRGIEVLTLDKKQTWSIPDLRSETPEAQAYLTSIAQRIKDLRPLGMFRLSDSEFLIAYTECAVYVNKHGDVSRSVVMEFVGHAHSACLYGRFLILFNDDFVEVRNAMNGRLRQVIPGRNVICLDDGSSLPGSSAASNVSMGMATSAGGGSINLTGGLSGPTNGVSPAETGRTVKICMQHPELPRSQIILELIENEGQQD